MRTFEGIYLLTGTIAADKVWIYVGELFQEIVKSNKDLTKYFGNIVHCAFLCRVL